MNRSPDHPICPSPPPVPLTRIPKDLHDSSPAHPRRYMCGTAALGGGGLGFRSSPITRFSGVLPPPSPVIPDWRALARVHSKSSQIGVGFSGQASIGVGFRRVVWLIASCQLLAACFQRPSSAQLFRSGANPQIYHLFAPSVKTKSCPTAGWSKALALRIS